MKTMPEVATMINGVDVTKLNETIMALKETPTLAKFKFSNNNRWLGGAHNRSTIEGFYGANENIRHAAPFSMDTDESPILLGNDLGPNPAEALLHAFAGCITTTMIFHAAARGLTIEEMETSFEGDVDLYGFLGLRDDVRPGFQGIRVTVRVKGDLTDEQIQEIGGLAPRFSPVFDTITRGTQVALTTIRK